MTTSSRIRECVDRLTLAYYDLSKYPKNDKYHWVIKNQIGDLEFDLVELLGVVERYEAAYARRSVEDHTKAMAQHNHMPPAG